EEYRRICRGSPFGPAVAGEVGDGWLELSLLYEPLVYLTLALRLGTLVEDKSAFLLHPATWLLFDAVIVSLYIPASDVCDELSAACLLLPGFAGALAKDRKLHLAHRSLHAQQQPVVRHARVIDAVLVDD